jgi:hypothetical protein
MGTLKRKLKAAQQREKRIKEREKVKKKKHVLSYLLAISN